MAESPYVAPIHDAIAEIAHRIKMLRQEADALEAAAMKLDARLPAHLRRYNL